MRRRTRTPKAERGTLCYEGIGVCERWNDFEAFLQDMGEPPKGMSIDRIDSRANYAPANCRWADATTQSRNRKIVKMSPQKAGVIRGLYEFSRMTQQELADRYNISQFMVSLIVRREAWI